MTEPVGKIQIDDSDLTPEYPNQTYAWYVVWILMLAYTCSFIDRQILSLLVIPIKRDLGISDLHVGFLQGFAFVLFYAFMGIPIGRLADSKSRRTIIMVGVTLWSFMTAMCGVARNYSMLFVARMGVGVGEATLSPCAYSMITDYFPREKLSRAMSVYAMGVLIGSGMALLIGGGVIGAVIDAPPVTLPVLGEIGAWQLTFFIVGFPGLLVVLLMSTVKEPVRLGRLHVTEVAEKALPIREVAHYLRLHWKTYMAHTTGFTLMGLVAYGHGAWAPTFMVRTYGWELRDIGFAYGIIAMVFGTAGVLSGGWFSDYLYKNGYVDAPMRAAMFALILWLPFSVLSNLMPTAWLSLALSCPGVFFLSFPAGLVIASLQMITPNEMRGQVSALYLFISNLVAFGCGPIVIALMTDYLFHDEAHLRYSMSLAAGMFIPLGAVILFLGLKPFRRTISAQNEWDDFIM
ncbi:MAG: MFS transporter [Deltaproteobacteria bacterium]|nr:MFS transporter [Deltaproteobacteria bacterium]